MGQSFNAIHIVEDNARRIITWQVSSILTYTGYAPPGSATSSAVWSVKRNSVIAGLPDEDWATSSSKEILKNISWDTFVSDPSVYFAVITPTYSESLVLDGLNDNANGGDVHLYDRSNQFSVGLWVKPDNLSSTYNLYSKSTNDANVYGKVLNTTAAGVCFWQMRTASTLRQHTFSETLNAGAWNFVLLTYDGSSNINGTRLYVNNMLDTVPSSGSLSGTLLVNQDSMFGRRNATFEFPGKMGHMGFWDKALSASEASQVYGGGSFIDYTALSFADDLANFYPIDSANDPLVLDAAGSNNLTLNGGVTFDTDTP